MRPGSGAWRRRRNGNLLARGTGTLKIAVRKRCAASRWKKLDDAGAGVDWAIIDRRGTAANFNSDSKPYDVTGAVMIAGEAGFTP